MLESILRFSIRQRWVVLAVTLGIAALGIYNYQNLPIDAVPDITNVQVQINTEAGGFTPFEVEFHSGDRFQVKRMSLEEWQLRSS